MINPAPIQNALMVEGNQASWGRPWATWFTQVFNLLFALQQSGVTADRPTRNLWVSRTFFDETLGMPIWWNGTIWVKSDGTAA